MEEWQKSLVLANLNEVKEKDAWMFPDITYLSKMLVTLHKINIYKKQLSIEAIGPTVWVYTTNYYMGQLRYYKTDPK